MAEIAALQLEADSNQIKETNAALREMAPAATAAEKAAERWNMTTKEAGRSTEDFSRRVQNMIKQLEFERAQLTRTAAEQAKYSALRRAGVSAASAEGQAIAASVAALQAQKAASKGAFESLSDTNVTAKVGAKAFDVLKGSVLSLAAAFSIEAIISRVSDALREVADLGETADQIGVTVNGLQALQFQAVQNGISLDQLNTGIGKFSENIGKAADGDKAMIESLQGLGVKILDIKGNLVPTEDLLVQVAKKIMAIDDPARRVAAAVDLFGKAGKQMLPTLAEIAKGFGSMSAQAQAAGAIISDEAIAKLDKLADSAAKTHLVMRAFFAENAAGPLTDALGLVEVVLNRLSVLAKTVRGDLLSLLAFAVNPGGAIGAALASKSPMEAITAEIEKKRKEIGEFQRALDRGDLAPRQVTSVKERMAASQAAVDSLTRQQGVMAVAGKAGPPAPGDPDAIGVLVNRQPKGVLDPKIKGAGDAAAKAYQKIIDSAKDYIATKNSETAAIGLGVEAAARLKHETELTSKATNDNTVLTAAQKEQIKALAGAMAEADTKFASAKFMDDAVTKSNEFIAAQKIEQDTLWMSAEAADAYRIAQGYLNDAKSKGIELTAAEKAQLQDLANQQAKASAETKRSKEIYDLARDSFTGFFTDMKQGLTQGKSVWESFGNAASNALDKIANKLIEMAAQKLFESAFGGAPGSSSAGGGFLSGIGSFLSNWLGGAAGGAAGGGLGGGSGITFANGAAFRAGNVIPFARGGIVSRPTLFPMANGMGLMGEAGPEAVMPLRRGPGGRLGVSMPDGGGQQQPVIVHVTGDTDLVRVHAEGAAVKVYNQREPTTVGKSVKQATRLAPAAVARHPMEREGEWRIAGA